MSEADLPRVLLTHPDTSEGDLLRLSLHDKNISILHLPLISVVGVESSQLDNQIKTINPDDILVFTSKNGVEFFCEVSKRLEVTFSANRVYALGEKTADVARQNGFSVAFVGSGTSSKVFADEILKRNSLERSTRRFVLLRGDRASLDLPQSLSSNGCHVLRITLYQSRPVNLAAKGQQLLQSWLANIGPSSFVVFTSSMAAEVFYSHLQQNSIDPLLNNLNIAVLGVTTRDRVVSFGFKNILMPDKATMADLSSMISQHMTLTL